jgi:hypothetical protein
MTKAEKDDRYARRFSTPHSCYECELTSDVLDELLCPRGASKPPSERRRERRTLSPPSSRKPGFGFSCRLLVVLAIGLCVFWAGESRRAPSVSPPLPVSRDSSGIPSRNSTFFPASVSPSSAPLPIAAPGALEGAGAGAPFSLGSGGWRRERWKADSFDGEIPVRRATRVFTVGRPAVVRMPDGALVHTTFRGIKDTFAQLPGDPQWGDAWEILEGVPNLWVWYCLRGHSAPAWVDP